MSYDADIQIIAWEFRMSISLCFNYNGATVALCMCHVYKQLPPLIELAIASSKASSKAS